MGCAATKAEKLSCLHPNKPTIKPEEELRKEKEDFHDQYHNLVVHAVTRYQNESNEYLNNLKLEPKVLLPESLKYGYISANTFFNLFHAGFHGPYIANPNYMLLVDFRNRNEFDERHLLTAKHFETLTWNMVEYPELESYSVVVFYDYDGTAAANIYSILYKAFNTLKRKKVEEVFCILGGISSVERLFPHLLARRGSNCAFIPWMPTLVKTSQLFLGCHEQAEERAVFRGLTVTHVLSIGRSPENRFENVVYLGLDGERNLLETLEASGNIIESVIEKNGVIFVHGVEGLNRSAAVIIAYLMKATPCTLEDAFFYVRMLRPFLRVDDECLNCLVKYEKLLFGIRVTDTEELWM